MNGLVIITNKKKLLLCLAGLLFIIISALIIAQLDFPKAVTTDAPENRNIMSPENENQHLKDILSSILPANNDILYENYNRDIEEKKEPIKASDKTVAEVISKGKTLSHLYVYSDEEYLRPIYSNLWKQSFFQGWLYLPRKVITARHNLFIYTGGAGKIFDMEGQLGFYPNISLDNQNYFNFLIFNFESENVLQLGNNIAITGKPTKKGVQIISVKLEEVSALINETGNITVHLCTPKGFEIDYQNLMFSKDSNRIEDYGPIRESSTASIYNESDLSSLDISQQNTILKKELSYFVSDSSKPIYFLPNGTYETSNALSESPDLEVALNNAKEIKFSTLYNNKKYISPVYHPKWKSNHDKDWCYIPRKMYLNMKRVFVLPNDKEVSADLLGELGFFEKYKEIPKEQTGIAVSNFNINKAYIYEDSILLVGTPSRTGMEIIGIDRNNLNGYNEFAVRLVTPDACEIDSDILKN